MNFLDKERRIIERLQQTKYEMFDGDKEEAFDFVSEQLEKFPQYTNIVIREQIMMPIWRFRYDGEELRDKIQDIDQKRKIAHDSAIASVNILNRLSKNLGLEPFADIDTNDRHEVANFVGQYVNEVYNKGIGNTFDDATHEKTEEYDTKKISSMLKEVPDYHFDNESDNELELK